MEELTESLVTCMTGEEGRGGDDQDLDDLVIRQLRDENEKDSHYDPTEMNSTSTESTQDAISD